jgi:hypothetical protein
MQERSVGALWQLQVSFAHCVVSIFSVPVPYKCELIGPAMRPILGPCAESRWRLMTTKICEPEENLEGLPVVPHPFSESPADERPRLVFFYSLCIQRFCGYARQATTERVFSTSILCPRCRSILVSACSRCGSSFESIPTLRKPGCRRCGANLFRQFSGQQSITSSLRPYRVVRGQWRRNPRVA